MWQDLVLRNEALDAYMIGLLAQRGGVDFIPDRRQDVGR